MLEGRSHSEISTRLANFKFEWLSLHPNHSELLKSSKPALETFFSKLTPEVHILDDDLQNHIVLYSVSPNSKGYYPQADSMAHAGGMVTNMKQDIEPLGIKNFAVFIEVDEQSRGEFGLVLFHEFFHLMIRENEEIIGLRFDDDYKFLEEGFVSYLARCALHRLSKNTNESELLKKIPIDPPQIILAALMDRLAIANKTFSQNPWSSIYYDVIERGIAALMLCRDKTYINVITKTAFDDEEFFRFSKYLSETSQTDNIEQQLDKSLKLYNLIDQKHFESWSEWEEWWTQNKQVLFRAIYMPPEIIIFNLPS